MEKVNLLVVDDTPSNLVALSAVLDRPEYNVICASSGKEALEILAKDEFALVLLDVMMPEMDGYEVAARMKKDEILRYTPILFVSAIAKDLKEIYHGYATGGVDYMLKPLEPEVVQAKVAVFAELYRQKKEIQRKSDLIFTSGQAQSLEREQIARRKAEDAEHRFRNLVNALDHAIIWEAMPDFSKFTFISERVEAILGFPRERWLTEREFFIDHVLSEDRPLLLERIENLVGDPPGKMGERLEHRMISADGAIRWFHTGIQDERDQFGKVVCFRGLCVDISPLKKVEERLRQAIQAREEIVAIVAHDLRTPLTAADLGTSLLKLASDKEDIAEIKKQTNQVKFAIRQTIRLADDILDADRVESGNASIEVSDHLSSEIVEESVETLRPLAADKSIQLHVDTAFAPMMKCDRSRILQVLSNLIGNAIKFSPNHSEIWVCATSKNGDALFSVKDKGPGIAPDQIQNVFHRYWRAKNGRGPGLGLGLTISKGVVEAHGGQIWVESRDGVGSTFYFTIPREAPTQAI